MGMSRSGSALRVSTVDTMVCRGMSSVGARLETGVGPTTIVEHSVVGFERKMGMFEAERKVRMDG